MLHIEAIIQSMTQEERRKPSIIGASRKVRISKGSGTRVQDANQLLKQFEQMQKDDETASQAGVRQKCLNVSKT